MLEAGRAWGNTESMDAETLEWCQRLVACRSVTGEGTRDVMELCASELLQPYGLEPRLHPSQAEGSSQVNLVCLVRGREPSRPPLILNTHLDTVPPGDPGSWTECLQGPFSARVKGERIYGLGAADTKLDFVAKALALVRCGVPSRDTYLVATFGEEHGLVGAKELAAAGLLPKGALAFVGEPSHLQVVTAHKGLMVFQLEIKFEPHNEARQSLPLYQVIFEGRSAHSSTPALGLNAIQLAIGTLANRRDLHIASIDGGDAVNKVPARCEIVMAAKTPPMLINAAHCEPRLGNAATFVPGEVFSLLHVLFANLTDFANGGGPPETDYASPTLTFNAGTIHSRGDSILVEFEFRPPPSLSLTELRQGIDDVVVALARSHTRQGITLIERRANPAFRSAPANETVQLAMAALGAAHLPLETSVKAGCTEAGVYAGTGISPVVFGPGPSTGVIHAPNEYNLTREVDGALRFYLELLRL